MFINSINHRGAILVVYLLAGSILYPDPIFAQGLYRRYAGDIAGKYPIVMHLVADPAGRASGYYYYNKQRKPLDLTGALTGNGHWRLDETPRGNDGARSGRFKLATINAGLAGVWESPDGRKKLAVKLHDSYENAVALVYHSVDKVILADPALPQGPNLTIKISWLLPATDASADNTALAALIYWCVLDSAVDAAESPVPCDKLPLPPRLELMKTVATEEVNASFRMAMDAHLENNCAGVPKATCLSEEVYGLNWSIERHMAVMHNDDGLLSVRMDEYQNTGGAHPNYFSSFDVIILDGTRMLTLEEIFLPGSDPALSRLLEQRLREDSTEYREDPSMLFVDHIAPTDNFYVDGRSITFYYNPYEIAAYAYGPRAITLSFDELRGLLREDSPLARWVGKH